MRGRRVFDGDRVLPGSDLAVLVDGNRIQDIVPTASLAADVVRYGDPRATLLPGLIDAHVHLVFPGSADPIGALDRPSAELLRGMRDAAHTTLAAGVTTVRDLGDLRYLATVIGAETRADPGAGPTVYAAGPPLTTPGGHCWFLGGAVRGPQRLRAEVAARARRGAAVIKVMVTGGRMTPGCPPWETQFRPAELAAIRAAADTAGLPVAAHAHGVAGIRAALRAGFDTIEHATFASPTGIEPQQELIDDLAAAGVFVSLALGTDPRTGPLADAEQRRVSAVLALVARLHAAGVRLVCSTDAGVSRHKPHGLLPHAVTALAAAGFPMAEVLRAATGTAAVACRAGDRTGRLRRGYDADILVLDGDPFAEPAAVHRVAEVYRGGRRVRKR